MENKFFCSEEHARAHAAERKITGVYMTLEQNVYSAYYVQGSVFNFSVRREKT